MFSQVVIGLRMRISATMLAQVARVVTSLVISPQIIALGWCSWERFALVWPPNIPDAPVGRYRTPKASVWIRLVRLRYTNRQVGRAPM